MSEKNYTIRAMTAADYDGLKSLWMGIHGFGIRSIDDSREGLAQIPLLRSRRPRSASSYSSFRAPALISFTY